MGDLLDQYDTSTHTLSGGGGNTNPFLDDIEPISSGYVTVPTATMEEEEVMFAREVVNIGSNVGKKIVDVAVANNVMVVVYQVNVVLTLLQFRTPPPPSTPNKTLTKP